MSNIMNFEVTRHSMTLPFRNAARDNTVDIPRKLSVPCPAILSHEALITMASVPAARGDDITAYALLPEIVWQTLITHKPLKMKTHPFARIEGIILCGSSKAEFTELRLEEFCSPANRISKVMLLTAEGGNTYCSLVRFRSRIPSSWYRCKSAV
jgi:hypothetical protein